MKTASAIFMMIGSLIWLICMILCYRFLADLNTLYVGLKKDYVVDPGMFQLVMITLILIPLCFLISSAFMLLSKNKTH